MVQCEGKKEEDREGGKKVIECSKTIIYDFDFEVDFDLDFYVEVEKGEA